MDDKHWTHLTPQETLDAIAIDFQQYPPQPRLLDRLTTFLMPAHGRTQTTGEALFLFLLHHMETRALPLPDLARVAEMVFETRTAADMEKAGIWIKDQMEEFTCTLCGDCCTDLFYQNGCTREDVHQWKTRGRRDILERVKVVTPATGKPQYQIWWDAEADRIFSKCPWLLPLDGGRGFHCGIHQEKPMVCRQYPFTRKHARMTGCPGRFQPCHREGAKKASKASPKPVSIL